MTALMELQDVPMKSSEYRPATQWFGRNPFQEEPGAQPPGSEQLRVGGRTMSTVNSEANFCAALDRLHASLDRGYWRVAFRRFLMLTCRGYDIPAPTRARCEELSARLKPRELEKMLAAAANWPRLSTGRPNPERPHSSG
jgi:hypothetical protein